MADRPLLLFPSPTPLEPQRRGGGASGVSWPSAARQTARLSPRFQRLQDTFTPQHVELLMGPEGAAPERVLVFEVVGEIQDFFRAVERIEGLEWLADWEAEDLEPSDDFRRLNARKEPTDKPLTQRLYAVMSDQRGAEQLIRLWDRYAKEGETVVFGIGLTKWRDLFARLHDVRFWGPQDRLEETGLREDWEERLTEGGERVRLEVELWFRRRPDRRSEAEDRVRRLVRAADGRVVADCQIPEIEYHALLVDLPIHLFEKVVDQLEARIVKCDDVMFLRPRGQVVIAPAPGDEPEPSSPEEAPSALRDEEPRVALLDGLPLANHPRLEQHLVIDDPEGLSESYPVAARRHGTAMASLIVHGDLAGDTSPLPGPLYVRPVLAPDETHPGSLEDAPEQVPPDQLLVDLVHSAVKRMCEGEGDEPPACPRVRVVNLSLGDATRPFVRALSPWARLLDYLAWRYRILFVVSAGNHASVPLSVAFAELEEAKGSSDSMEQLILRSIWDGSRHRRLLSPAESVNALTVGAAHADDALEGPPSSQLIEPFPREAGLPAPYSALGLGFRRAIKPDLLMAGGRQLYRAPVTASHRQELTAVRSPRPPGQRVAMPRGQASGPWGEGYERGTSNAAALTTRAAARLLDLLDELGLEPGGEQLQDDRETAVLLKALLVHGAGWHGLDERLRHQLDPSLTKDDVARFLGYGTPDLARALACTQQRATLLGCSEIGADEGHRYHLPLPISLGGRLDWRRLTITLAWLTPIHPGHAKYRRADLWFAPYGDSREAETAAEQAIGVSRKQNDWRTVRRGTVQHEVLEGKQATVFGDGAALEVQVNCRAGAGKLEDSVPYALVATLEVAEGVDIAIYDEIRAQIRPPVTVAP